MKLIYAAREKPNTGRAPTLQILHTLRGLCVAADTVTFVTPWPAARVQRKCRELTGHDLPPNLHIVSLGPGPDLPLIRRYWPTRVWSGIRARLRRYLCRVRRTDPDAVVYTRNRCVAAEIAGDDVPPIVLENHELRSRDARFAGLEPDHPELRAARDLERDALQRAAGLVALTQCLADDMRQDYAIDRKIWVIPDGADAEIFGIAPEQRRAHTGRLLYTGSLSPWKGLDLALGALARVPGVTLDLCGGREGSEDWLALTNVARQCGVLDRIRLHGTVPQPRLRPLLAAATAGLLPLDGRYAIAARYTSPLKLFEYLTAGLPVIATDLPSVREVISDGEQGVLFRDRDVDSLARAISDVVTRPDLAQRLSAGAQAASSQYTWQRRGERIVAVCRSVLETASRSAA